MKKENKEFAIPILPTWRFGEQKRGCSLYLTQFGNHRHQVWLLQKISNKDENKWVLLPSFIWFIDYLRCHVLTDGFDLHFDISDQQVELILYELQSVHLILSVLQCCYSKAPPQQQQVRTFNLTYCTKETFGATLNSFKCSPPVFSNKNRSFIFPLESFHKKSS